MGQPANSSPTPSPLWSSVGSRCQPKFSNCSPRAVHSCFPRAGDWAVISPRVPGSATAWGVETIRSARSSPSRSGSSRTSWPNRAPSSVPFHRCRRAPEAPDQMLTRPRARPPNSAKRAPAATSGTSSPSTSRGEPKRKPTSPHGTSPSIVRCACNVTGPGVRLPGPRALPESACRPASGVACSRSTSLQAVNHTHRVAHRARADHDARAVTGSSGLRPA